MVECLKYYKEKARELQQPGSEEKHLFLSYVRPHKPVASQGLAHWVKELLTDAGVDESHSVRGASTSAAMARGLSLADILSTADWSRESTFKRFYNRETKITKYVSKVLQGGGSASPH